MANIDTARRLIGAIAAIAARVDDEVGMGEKQRAELQRVIE